MTFSTPRPFLGSTSAESSTDSVSPLEAMFLQEEREREDGCHYISIYQGILRTVRVRWPAEIPRYLSPSPCAIAAAGPSDSAARHLPRSFPHCSLWMTDMTSCAREVDPSNGELICRQQ
jgi:hypothetical protein